MKFKNKKVLLFPQGPVETPSSRYRVYQFIPVFENHGIRTKVFSSARPKHKIKIIRMIVLFADIAWSDVLFVQKHILRKSIVLLAKLFKKKIIFDIDDAIWLLNTGSCKSVRSHEEIRARKRLDQFIKNDCDLVVAGNQYLKDYCEDLQPVVSVIPTLINTNVWRKRKSEDNFPITLGWIGTKDNLPFLQKLDSVFRRLYEDFGNKIVLKVVSNGTYISNSSIHVENVHWSLDSEIIEVDSFDIGLMPLPDDGWTKGKCAFKILQYMSMEIPSVASPVGMNNDVIIDGVNGYLAHADDDWYSKLYDLIEKADVRHHIGIAGRKTVELDYSLTMGGNELVKVIRSL